MRRALLAGCLVWLVAVAAGASMPAALTHDALVAEGARPVFYQLSEPSGTAVGTMILIHGGGWTDSGPAMAELGMAGATQSLLSLHWRVLNIGYTSALANRRAPDPMRTLSDVLAFYDQARADFRGPICADGTSAGGHLAMMLAVERPSLTCVVSNAGPLDLLRTGNRSYSSIVRSVFGTNPQMLRWWSPALRWSEANPSTRVWIGDAQGDPLVPAMGPEFRQIDPDATVTELPRAQARTPGAAWFVHSWVRADALSAYYQRLANWLMQSASSAPATQQPDPVAGGTLLGCDAAQTTGTRSALLLADSSGWQPVSTPFAAVQAYRSCDGQSDTGWDGLSLLAEPNLSGTPVPSGQSAELDLTAPRGHSLVALTAQFRGWFANLRDWDLGLYASRSSDGPVTTPVAACSQDGCQGLRTFTERRGAAIAPAGAAADPAAAGNLPSQTFALPAGTRRLSWRLTCTAPAGCADASINPGHNPYSSDPSSRLDPIGHPAEFTVSSLRVRLAPDPPPLPAHSPSLRSAHRTSTSLRAATQARGSANLRVGFSSSAPRLRVRTQAPAADNTVMRRFPAAKIIVSAGSAGILLAASASPAAAHCHTRACHRAATHLRGHKHVRVNRDKTGPRATAASLSPTTRSTSPSTSQTASGRVSSPTTSTAATPVQVSSSTAVPIAQAPVTTRTSTTTSPSGVSSTSTTGQTSLCPGQVLPNCPPTPTCSSTSGVNTSAGITALPADGLVSSIGVNTHLSYLPDTYTGATNNWLSPSYTTVNRLLLGLGVRYIRDVIPPDVASRGAYYQEMAALAGDGIKTDVVLPSPQSITSATWSALTTMNSAGLIASLEPENETDLLSGDYSAVAQAQPQLYSFAHGDGLEVLSPSVADPVHFVNWESYSLSSVLDAGNLHIYGQGDIGGAAAPYTYASSLAPAEGCATLVAGSKPDQVTESGYSTGPETSGWTVSTDAQGAYVPRILLTDYAAGIQRTYLYELMDETPYLSGFEGAFGLAGPTGQPKPAYTAVQTLIHLLADPGPAFNPASLAYSVTSNAPHPLNTLLLQKRDGSFWLALWQDATISDPATGNAVSAPTATAHITLPRSMSSSVYQLRSGSNPVSSAAASRYVTVSVPGDDTTLVRLGS